LSGELVAALDDLATVADRQTRPAGSPPSLDGGISFQESSVAAGEDIYLFRLSRRPFESGITDA
jgi:hypothetical protein